MSTANVPVNPAQTTASPAPKPRRWIWILGICAAFLVGIGLGAGTTQPQDRDAGVDKAAATPTAPPETYTSTAPAPPPVTVTAPAPAPVTVTKEAEKPANSGQTLGNGVHQVGVDVQPGRYKTDGPTGSASMGMCFWSRNKDDSGNFEAIITNGIVQGPGSLTINAGEFVEISGDCTWTKVG